MLYKYLNNMKVWIALGLNNIMIFNNQDFINIGSGFQDLKNTQGLSLSKAEMCPHSTRSRRTASTSAWLTVMTMLNVGKCT